MAAKKVMRWLPQHDILLCREVAMLDPYQHFKGSKERAALWEKIATNLDGTHLSHQITFSVTGRSVRDRVNLVLIKNYRKKVRQERAASGVAIPPPSELDTLMEDICNKESDSDKAQRDGQAEKKGKEENERKIAEEVRARALERVGQTKKRLGSEPKEGRAKRRSGGDTMDYLKERSEQQQKIKEEEQKLQREAQEAQAKAQQAFLAQMLQQQQNMFAAMQREQQQQQWQQQQQMQASIMMQQQQSQAMMAILEKVVKKDN